MLPRLYLNGFCAPAIHCREKHDEDNKRSRCRVWVHDRQIEEVKERGTKNLSTYRHFYSAETPAGSHDAEPEQALAEIETKAAPIIKGLTYGCSLSPEDRAELAKFAMLMN